MILVRPARLERATPKIRSLGSDIDSSQLLCKPGIKQLIADQYVNDRAANQEAQPAVEREEASTSYLPIPQGDQTTSKRAVREPSTAPRGHRDYQQPSQSPAHPSNYLVAQLNATWRVVDDPPQWRLQRKKGNPRSKNPGWRDRSFCSTREGLLRCAREHCGNVEPAGLAKLTALPEHHAMPNLDVRGTDQAEADGQSKPLVAKEGCTSPTPRRRAASSLRRMRSRTSVRN